MRAPASAGLTIACALGLAACGGGTGHGPAASAAADPTASLQVTCLGGEAGVETRYGSATAPPRPDGSVHVHLVNSSDETVELRSNDQPGRILAMAAPGEEREVALPGTPDSVALVCYVFALKGADDDWSFETVPAGNRIPVG
ncbi:MAG: hypothetical protein R3C15_22670 [Thermoleophilia bacterium]